MPSVFDQLGALGTGIAGLAIVLVVAFLIISQGRTQVGELEGVNCANFSVEAGGGGTSVACNATATLQGAVEDIPGWIPLVVIAAIGAILLGLVAMFNRKR